MASPTSTQHLFSNLAIDTIDHDPGGTGATVASEDGGTTQHWYDMRDYTHFGVVCITTVLGGSGPTLVEIVAADDTAGTNATQIKTSGTVAADALNDAVYLECNEQEVRQESEDAGYTLRYVTARITCDNAGDEAIVVLIGKSKNPQLDLTAATDIS